jgi:hypothetical protein
MDDEEKSLSHYNIGDILITKSGDVLVGTSDGLNIYDENKDKFYTILDLFGGSGSTLIACEQLNRKCYMMELDEHYCDVIIDRWQKLTGKTAVKIEQQ